MMNTHKNCVFSMKLIVGGGTTYASQSFQMQTVLLLVDDMYTCGLKGFDGGLVYTGAVEEDLVEG